MKNRLTEIIKRILPDADGRQGGPEDFEVRFDSDGVKLYLEKSEFDRFLSGEGAPNVNLQGVVLRMLEEQGLASRFPNGFSLEASVAASLDNEQAEILGLPPRFSGEFKVSINGHSNSKSFSVKIFPEHGGGQVRCSIKGALMEIGSANRFLLDQPQLQAFQAVERHSQLPEALKTSSENLLLLATLQLSKRSGMNIDLSHFERINVETAEDVGVIAKQLPDGSLELFPSVGDGYGLDEIEGRLGQLDLDDRGGVIRIKNNIIILDEKKMSAVKEVMNNRRIPADSVADFIKSPSAFLDASLVNLDLGFSVRVLGIGKIKHMDFGGLGQGDSDWFGVESSASPPEIINKLVKSHEELAELQDKIDSAYSQGAQTVVFQGESIDISDSGNVQSILANIVSSLEKPEGTIAATEESAEKSDTQVGVIVKDADDIGEELLAKINSHNLQIQPDWEAYARQPFPHQAEGVNWMLRLVELSALDDSENFERIQGGLLADDMGLGKTYMSLVAINEYLSHRKHTGLTEKPILIVAPLSLLENWEQEVSLTYKSIPFKDVKVLQAGRDLAEFKKKGEKRESVQASGLLDDEGQMDKDKIRFALHVGPDAGLKRLDINRRLVITTYQTLRDYQLSLCLVDWGMVIFDEAQNLKNPNTLQTHAAKGLNSDIKILATGTPVENSLGDFWCLMDTAQPGLLGDWVYFRDRWVTPILRASEDERNSVRESVGQDLRRAAGSFMLRRIKEDQLKALPPKSILSGVPTATHGASYNPKLSSSMNGYQLLAYNEAIEMYRKRRAEEEDVRGFALSTLQNLRAISLHPRANEPLKSLVSDPDSYRKIMLESAKMSVMLDILDEIKAAREKVIVFILSKNVQRFMKVWLDRIYGLDVNVINGDTSAVEKKSDSLTRKGLIEQFESVEGFNIIIMSPVAAGVGLTVVGANHVIHLERHWNPAKEAQATDRVYRIGQKRAVSIHIPTALHPEFDSFDVHLDRLLSGKLLLKDAVVTTDVVSESEVMKSLGLD
ncbi:DEAD/DEAH box helicase [Billgrantia ethanolica]|uniref:DEAD/DEAH box helicase n=1 Tax=Billgrantia ethanolica TaxID=2733486 RepID=A0ABS9A6F4_9GAMM|nr:DEAD/DEAH box helicase [Halomonas ethanolica]MCE8004412.1 DEAD/DEAH box helicase [Halomonas ethanolica]